jgi:hypothetical protein
MQAVDHREIYQLAYLWSTRNLVDKRRYIVEDADFLSVGRSCLHCGATLHINLN